MARRLTHETDLYPLRWQDATSLPAHAASFAFAASAPATGYACATTASTTPVAHASAAASSSVKSTPERGSVLEPTPTTTVVSTDTVYHSEDGGMTWAGLRTPFAPARACHVFVAPLDADQLFIAQPANATDDSGLLPLVWQSSDGGESWQVLGQMFGQVGERESVTGLVPIGGQLVAEAPSIGPPSRVSQFYATADDGKTWRLLPTPVTLTGLYGVGTTLYAYAVSSPDAGISSAPLYRSTDAGATWTLVSPPFASVSDLAFVRSTDGATTYGVGLIPADTAYGSQGHQVIVSKDGGATWSRIDAPPTLGTLDAVMLPDGTLLLQSQLQDTQPAGGFIAEIFRLAPGETAWKLIGIGPYVNGWQFASVAAASGATIRLWAAAPSPNTPARVVWADLP